MTGSESWKLTHLRDSTRFFALEKGKPITLYLNPPVSDKKVFHFYHELNGILTDISDSVILLKLTVEKKSMESNRGGAFRSTTEYSGSYSDSARLRKIPLSQVRMVKYWTPARRKLNDAVKVTNKLYIVSLIAMPFAPVAFYAGAAMGLSSAVFAICGQKKHFRIAVGGRKDEWFFEKISS